jgi:hypothetical protein
MALGPLRDSGVEVSDGLQGDAALGHKRLDQQGIGDDDALIGGERCGSLDGVAALGDHVFRAYVVVAEEGLTSGAARALGRCEGGPATQKVTENVRVCILQPVQHLREIVLQRTGEVVRNPHFIPDHAPTMCDELCEGAHGRALRIEWLQFIPMRAQQCELQFGVAGSSFARLGVKASRYRAKVSGWIGKRTRKSYWRRAKTRGPLFSSRQRATGWP